MSEAGDLKGKESLFLLRRLHGFALITDGIGHVFGLRLGLGLRTGKRMARVRMRARDV